MAVELFNAVWGLLESENRNCAETDRMIHAAHASRFHWEIAGQPINWGIGEWQVSRVHAVLKQQDSALYHARRYLEIAEDYDLGPFHVAYAHEAIARAFAINNPEKAAEHLAKAREHGEKIGDAGRAGAAGEGPGDDPGGLTHVAGCTGALQLMPAHRVLLVIHV